MGVISETVNCPSRGRDSLFDVAGDGAEISLFQGALISESFKKPSISDGRLSSSRTMASLTCSFCFSISVRIIAVGSVSCAVSATLMVKKRRPVGGMKFQSRSAFSPMNQSRYQ